MTALRTGSGPLWHPAPHPAPRRSRRTEILLIIFCLFFPFLAVLIHDGPSKKVLWALLLQLVGHVPGVVYGIYQVTRD